MSLSSYTINARDSRGNTHSTRLNVEDLETQFKRFANGENNPNEFLSCGTNLSQAHIDAILLRIKQFNVQLELVERSVVDRSGRSFKSYSLATPRVY